MCHVDMILLLLLIHLQRLAKKTVFLQNTQLHLCEQYFYHIHFITNQPFKGAGNPLFSSPKSILKVCKISYKRCRLNMFVFQAV